MLDVLIIILFATSINRVPKGTLFLFVLFIPLFYSIGRHTDYQPRTLPTELRNAVATAEDAIYSHRTNCDATRCRLHIVAVKTKVTEFALNRWFESE